MRDKDTPVYMISVVAQLVGVHPQTLRFYENEGLLKPSRTEGRTRLYSEADLERARRIVSLTRDRGVNVAGVDLILKMEEDMDKLLDIFSSILDSNFKASLLKEFRREEFEEIDIGKILDILS